MGVGDYARVVDYTFTFDVSGKDGVESVTYPVRDGDVVGENPKGAFMIQFAPREILIGRDIVKVEGDTVLVPWEHVTSLRQHVRYELKVRPSVKSYLQPEQAAIEQLEQKLSQ